MKMSSIIGRMLVFLLSFSLFLGCASNSGSNSSDQDPGSDPLPPPDPSISIFINQVETECIEAGVIEVRAQVSVIDELGDRINNLILDNFQVQENSTVISSGITFSENSGEEITTPNSIAILMDYSGSVTEVTETKTAMEDAVLNFIDLMKENDRAAILKFNDGIRLIESFTEDRNVLESAIYAEVEVGNTYLYDSLYESITLFEDEPDENRKAVVAITDGKEAHTRGVPGDGRTVDDIIAISQEKGIPVFIIGLGNEINVEVLQSIADGTYGHYYQAASQNELLDIYAKISDVLNTGQYSFIFDSISSDQSSGDLIISVEHGGLSDMADATFSYPTCN